MITRIALLLAVAGSLCFTTEIIGQPSFYDIDKVREIRIDFYEKNWDHILDSLYIKGDKDRMLGAVTIEGERFDSVGIRYKGFSSVSVDRLKNPFNIKLNYTDPDLEYQGLDKLKLSNVIQDPSFVRETLSYEIARKYMPASGANYANLFINDTLWGLYTNVEAVAGEFLNDRYNSNDNSFFKCNPQQLDLFGENSTLSNTHGTDTSDYYPYYTIKSDHGWADLYKLIDTLNNSKNNIESILNVDRTLWMHAFNYALINFDSYIGYAQNFYLYYDDNRIWNPIIWDLNMSIGSFRFTDASDNFGGFTIPQAFSIDPLQHYNSVSVFPRPLMRNLFENQRYRKMYLAHMRTIVDENFTNQDYYARAQLMQSLIDIHVLNDTNKFYSYNDFNDNLNNTVSDLIDYPGISELIDNRTAYLNSYPGFRGEPQINSTTNSPLQISAGDDVTVISKITNANEAFLSYRMNENGLFQTTEMFDDGAHGDSLANDGIYAVTLANVGTTLQYYIYAENDTAGSFSPSRAAYEFFTLQSKVSKGDLVINEFMAKNGSTVADPSGEFDDWIELYNNSNEVLSLAGLYLSDNKDNLSKWAFPDITINARDYLIVWADENSSQAGYHTNFKLDATAEELYMSYGDGTIIDSVHFADQNSDFCTGRYPNGTGPFVILTPTFDSNNNLARVLSSNTQSGEIILFPNPTRDALNIATQHRDPFDYEIYDFSGKMVMTNTISNNTGISIINTVQLSNGMYLLRTKTDNFNTSEIFIIN